MIRGGGSNAAIPVSGKQNFYREIPSRLRFLSLWKEYCYVAVDHKAAGGSGILVGHISVPANSGVSLGRERGDQIVGQQLAALCRGFAFFPVRQVYLKSSSTGE